MKLTALEILSQLVAFPTVSRDTNRPLIDWVRNYLNDLGIDSQLIPDSTGRKSNLLASIGPAEAGGLALSGHTDVVPVDGQQWSSDPFTLTAKGSRLYGRGTCDMKGFIATVLAATPGWKGMELRRPIHLMFSYDEEVGCLGAPAMIAAARSKLPPPGAVIVGEPTGMQLANQHKGLCALRTRVRGVAAHSSLTSKGMSAVMLASELIAQLASIERARKTGVHVAEFEPPYTTLSVNRINGGTAFNILAAECEFDWDIRTLPGDHPDAILQRLSQYAEYRLAQLSGEGRPCAIETTLLADAPALRPEQGTAERLVRDSLDGASEPMAVPFGTEGGQFQREGWSTVVCGPGEIAQAHKADEFIEQEQIARCHKLLSRAVSKQCQLE